MLPDRVSNREPLTYESGALPIALCGPAIMVIITLKFRTDGASCLGNLQQGVSQAIYFMKRVSGTKLINCTVSLLDVIMDYCSSFDNASRSLNFANWC